MVPGVEGFEPIREFRERWPEIHRFSGPEIRAFFRLCSDPGSPYREEALGLLLSPNAPDLPGYYSRLLTWVAGKRIPVGEIPPELLQVLSELVSSAGSLPQDSALRKLFIAALRKMPRRLRAWFFTKRFYAGLFLDCLGRTVDRARPALPCLRPLRRLLKKTAEDPSPLVITVADLQPLHIGKPRSVRSKSFGRRIVRHVAARSAEVPPSPAPPLSKLYWGGRGNLALASIDRLIEAQAAELAEVRRLAEAVSAATGRVVLSWHNASLGSAGGWAFDNFAARFPSPRAYRDFSQAVEATAGKVRRELDRNRASDIFSMRARRIYSPKAAHALEQEKALRGFNRLRDAAWAETAGKAVHLLERSDISAIESGDKAEWPGAVAPHQRVGLGRALEWFERSKRDWADGLCLLFALAIHGRRALDSGLVSSFVLPWIDKFFISSRRRADLGYLETLFGFVRDRLGEPLVLFWEDTAHARVPSLALALEELSGRRLPFRGIGIFDRGPSKRPDAELIIAGEYPQTQLFALRPLNDNHFAGALKNFFDSPIHDFLSFYDSSWKDNFAFIYTGTQVFPLLSVQTEMEAISPWVSDGRGRYPFGAWFRDRLRAGLAGGGNAPSDPLWRSWSEWANLL